MIKKWATIPNGVLGLGFPQSSNESNWSKSFFDFDEHLYGVIGVMYPLT